MLYPFPEVFTPYAADQLGRHLELDTTRWEFYEEWGLDYAGFVDLVTQGVAERRLWWEGTPYADVPGAIDRIRAAGHRIHLVTARDISGTEAAMAATNHWLAAHGFVVESVNLAQDKPTRAGRSSGSTRRAASPSTTARTTCWRGRRAGVVAVVLDRWGTYRGDHRAARGPRRLRRLRRADRRRQLVGVAAHRPGRRRAQHAWTMARATTSAAAAMIGASWVKRATAGRMNPSDGAFGYRRRAGRQREHDVAVGVRVDRVDRPRHAVVAGAGDAGAARPS